MGDLLHASQGMPLIPFQRRMDLARLAEARGRLADAPGWCALFTHAFGRVAMLINEHAQSAAEHICLGFEAATRVAFVGSPTAALG